MKLFGFLVSLFRADTPEEKAIREAGERLATLFWEGFRTRMVVEAKQTAIELRGKAPEQLALDAPAPIDYGSWPRSALVSEAASRGFANTTSATKKELVQVLLQDDESQAAC